MNHTKPIIPSLGATAEAVLDEALGLDTAGFLLTFRVVGQGDIRSDAKGFYRAETVGGVPVIGRRVSDATMLGWISRGEVSIFVHHQNPSVFSKEYHRATGSRLPLS